MAKKEPLYPHVPKGKMQEVARPFPKMEGLIEILADIFNLPTTLVAKKLLESDIRSWADFEEEVNKYLAKR